ncbi:MAG: hypothetical protein KAS78_06430 [Candidatus Pacebacteria bacterium]|nr:hypothetical protein [Candidatus Paceibacterota bacterium]
MEKKKNKKINIPSAFMGIFIIILIILLFYIVGVLIQFRESGMLKNGAGSPDSQTHIEKTSKFASYFPECGLINDSCLDTTCGLYFLCNEEKYLICEIYDCGEEFGIGTEDKNGKIRTRREIKVDKSKVEELVSKCRGGSLSVMDKKCVENRLEVNVSLNIGDKCEIKNFMAEYDLGGEKKFSSVDKFSDLGDNKYLITINNCDDFVKLIAVGEGGVGIR